MTRSVSEFRFLKTAFVLIFLGLTWVSTSTAFAADPAGKVKPYPLNYCIMDGISAGLHANLGSTERLSVGICA